jgi:hypothetical protein
MGQLIFLHGAKYRADIRSSESLLDALAPRGNGRTQESKTNIPNNSGRARSIGQTGAIAAFQYGIQVARDEDILYVNLAGTRLRPGRREELPDRASSRPEGAEGHGGTMMIFVCFMLAANGGNLDRLTKEIAASGQVVGLAATPSERVAPPVEIAPGQPPLLSFRYYEGQQRHRFSNTELMLDDAGH